MAETTRALTYEELLFEYQRVQEELAQLKRLIFGQKRERFVPLLNEQQLDIALNEEPSAAPPVSTTTTTTISYTRHQKKSSTTKLPGRNPLPAHLRREEIRLEPEGDLSDLKKIGEEIAAVFCAAVLKYMGSTSLPRTYRRPPTISH